MRGRRREREVGRRCSGGWRRWWRGRGWRRDGKGEWRDERDERSLVLVCRKLMRDGGREGKGRRDGRRYVTMERRRRNITHTLLRSPCD